MKWALLWALLIFILCSLPGHDIPHISFLELLEFDKFIHAGIFFVLMLFMTRGLLLQERFPVLQKDPRLFSLLICIAYGGALELMQGAFFVERTADIYDFIANSFGALLALWNYNWIEKKILVRFIK
jgi:VanZ family protein